MPDDYVFEAAGARGASTDIGMSELFRGGATLMMYHYMFPRHSRDDRPAPASGAMANAPLSEGPCRPAPRSLTCGTAVYAFASECIVSSVALVLPEIVDVLSCPSR